MHIIITFVLVFVAMVGATVVARECSDKEFTGNKGRLQKHLQGFK
jgi:hypothetical protein